MEHDKVKRSREFTLELIKFYKSFIGSSSDAIKILVNIQKNYENEYKIMEELKDDPTILDELTNKLSPEEKNALILVFVKASGIGRKMNKLFELSVNEKEALIDELNKFAEFVEKTLKELIKEKS